MNTKTLITIKTDKSIKNMAQEIAQELGLPLSTIINSFLKQFIRDKEVTFSNAESPSLYLREVIENSERELKEGKITFYHNAESFLKNLKSVK